MLLLTSQSVLGNVLTKVSLLGIYSLTKKLKKGGEISKISKMKIIDINQEQQSTQHGTLGDTMTNLPRATNGDKNTASKLTFVKTFPNMLYDVNKSMDS